MIKEAVTVTFEEVTRAVDNGAGRIELCDNIAQGGTTPSFAMAKYAIEYCRAHGVEVAIMIRPRGGDFVYSIFEKEIMLHDIEVFNALNPDAYVFGALRDDDSLDKLFMEQLVRKAEGITTVMHMAFDQIPFREQLKTMDDLIAIGVDRILTHGNSDSSTNILENVTHLARLLRHSKGNISIMPGGGLNKDNLEQLLNDIPFQEVHGTKIV